MVSVIKRSNAAILRIKTRNGDVRTSSSKCQQSSYHYNVHASRFRNLYTRAKILLVTQKSLSADALQVLV